MEEVAKKVLIVDDELSIIEVVKLLLTKEGYEVETALDGREAIEKTHSFRPDLVLLDVMLPYIDGYQVCRKIREDFNMPIIMITAKDEEIDKVLGFELGADDYLTKPFGLKELAARVKANLRRAGISEVESVNQLIYAANLVINPLRKDVRKGDRVIELTSLEFDLVKYLAVKADQIVSREQLMKDVWGYDYFGDPRTVDVTVRRVREKIEDDPSHPRYILTKRGVGYYFNKN